MTIRAERFDRKEIEVTCVGGYRQCRRNKSIIDIQTVGKVQGRPFNFICSMSQWIIEQWAWIVSYLKNKFSQLLSLSSKATSCLLQRGCTDQRRLSLESSSEVYYKLSASQLKALNHQDFKAQIALGKWILNEAPIIIMQLSPFSPNCRGNDSIEAKLPVIHLKLGLTEFSSTDMI